jgi:hypothetical protein
VNHLLNLAHGLAVSLACGALFYLAGLVVIRRQWEPLLRAAALPFIGAAAYVLACWIAVSAREVSLVPVTAAFAGAVAVLALFRARWVSSIVSNGVHARSVVGTAITFGFFYIVAYVMTIPPVSEIFLPPAWSGNPDLLTHAQYARHLLLSGSTRLESASFDYRQSPAVSYLLALLSLGYSQDPLRSAMPLLFSLVSLTAVAFVRAARSLFGLSKMPTAALVAVFLTGPFLRYVSASYLVAWLAAFPILTFLFWAIRNTRPRSFIDVAAMTAFTSAYTLLFFLHPSLVFAAIAIQLIAAAVAGAGRSGWREATRLAFAAAVPTVLLSAAFVDRVQWAIADSRNVRTAFDLSNLPPQVWIGWPGRVPAQLRAELPAGAIALLLSALVLMSLARWFVRAGSVDRFARTRSDRRLMLGFLAYATVALVAANVMVHAFEDPRLIRLPGSWRGLEQLRNLPFGELTFRIAYDPSGLLAAATRYYLPNKRIHVVTRDVRTRDALFDNVTRQQPLLIQGFGCEGVGHREVVMIDRVGCALFAPPTLEIGKRYPFNRTMLAIEYDGMGERDPGGRWTRARIISLRVTVDPQRAGVDRELYVNLLVDPFLGPDEGGQRVLFSWGVNRRAEASATAASWIGVPVAIGDWTGNRLWTLRMRIELPERSILFRDLVLSDEPVQPGDVVQ